MQNETDEKVLSSSSRPIRLFKNDDDALKELHKAIKDFTSINITDLIRDCVKVGRPIIEKRWAPIVAEVAENKQQKQNEH